MFSFFLTQLHQHLINVVAAEFKNRKYTVCILYTGRFQHQTENTILLRKSNNPGKLRGMDPFHRTTSDLRCLNH